MRHLVLMRRLAKNTRSPKTRERMDSLGPEKFFSSRILREGIGLVLVPEPASQPTPGQFYQLKFGDTLFGISKKAYKTGSMESARLLNESRYNRRFWRAAPASERKMFPNGRISFSPRFTGDLRAQMESTETAPSGRSFAMIWIPTTDGREPF